MVISAAAKAAIKAARIIKAKRALKPAKTRSLKPRDRALKKVKVHKLKKLGKTTTASVTTVGKSNTSAAAKKAAAIKRIRSMDIERDQGIIVGIQGKIGSPNRPDMPKHLPQTWNNRYIEPTPLKFQKAIEYVKKAKVGKGENIMVRKAPVTDQIATPAEWGKIKPIPGLDLHDSFVTRRYMGEQDASIFSRKATVFLPDVLDQGNLIARKFPIVKPTGMAKRSIENKLHKWRKGKIAAHTENMWRSGYMLPAGKKPLRKAPRTVAGMDIHDWATAGVAGGMTATGFAVGKYDKEIGEHVKGNIKAHVKTGDTAIDVIKDRRDQLLRKLGLI